MGASIFKAKGLRWSLHSPNAIHSWWLAIKFSDRYKKKFIGHCFCDIWWLLKEPFCFNLLLHLTVCFSFRISSEEEQPGCWEVHRPERWWLHRATYSALRHSWWQVGDALEWFSSFCCPVQRYRQAQGFLRTNTQEPRPYKPERLNQSVERSCPCGEDGELCLLETEDQLEMIDF